MPRSLLPPTKPEGYTALDISDHEFTLDEASLQKPQKKQWSTFQLFALILVASIVSGLAGFTFRDGREIFPSRGLLGIINWPSTDH